MKERRLVNGPSRSASSMSQEQLACWLISSAIGFGTVKMFFLCYRLYKFSEIKMQYFLPTGAT